MNLRSGKQLGERAKELLRAIALLNEPFTTREIVAIAHVRSSVNHFLIQFCAVGYLKVESKGKHNQPFSYVRGDRFPDIVEIEAKKKPTNTDPVRIQSDIEKKYWEFRNSLNINPKVDEGVYD